MPSSNDESRTEYLPVPSLDSVTAAAANSSRATATAAAPANETDQLVAKIEHLLTTATDYHELNELRTTTSKLLGLLGNNTELITDDRIKRILEKFNVIKLGKKRATNLDRLRHIVVSVVYNVIFFVSCVSTYNNKYFSLFISNKESYA